MDDNYPIIDNYPTIERLRAELAQLRKQIEDLKERNKDHLLIEKRLHKSEKLYRSIVQSQTQLLCRFLPDGTLTFVNDAYCNCLGKTDTGLIGHNFLELVPHEERPRILRHLSSLNRENPIGVIEHKVVNQTGGIGWQRWVDRAIINKDGSVAEFQSVGFDITDRVEMERALLKEKEMAQKYLDIAGVILVVLDSRQQVSLINKKGCEILGCREAEIIGKNWFDCFIPEENREKTRGVYNRLMAGEEIPSEYFENPVITKGKELRIIAWHNAIIRDENGCITGTLSSGEDITESKKVQEALRASEQKLSAMLQSFSDHIHMVDKDFTITWANDQAKREFGGDIIGRKCYEVIYRTGSPCDKDKCLMQKALQDGKIHSGEACLVLKDGGIGWFHNTISVTTRDGEGNPLELITISRNITEQKEYEEALMKAHEEMEHKVKERTSAFVEMNKRLQEEINERRHAEKALRKSEERFRLMAELSPFPITIVDAAGSYLYANKRFTEVFGYTLADTPTGHAWFSLAYPDEAKRREAIAFWKSDLVKLKKGEVIPRVFKVACKDFSVRDIIFRPITMEDDKSFIIYEDITERKRAEGELSKAKEYMEKVFNSVTDAIIVTDMHAHIVTCNDATEGIYGYKKEELIGKSIKILFPDMQAFRDAMRDAKRFIEEQGYYAGETIKRHKNGQLMPISYRSSRLLGPDGGPVGIVEVDRDVTDQRQAEESRLKLESQLRQAQKMEAIGTLAGGIAHDFNNIISHILGYTELTLDDMTIGSRARTDMEQIIKACNRAKDMVKQILTFSSKIDHERKPVCITSLLEDALSFIRNTIPNTIDIQRHLDPDSGIVMANSIQIHQVILNLCSNAYYAMREKGGVLDIALGVIDIGTENKEYALQGLKEGMYVKLSVKDTGCGIEKANLERIFDPFFTTKPPGEGTGLGLATVHGIIQSHGGWIGVQSELGKGTTFEIYLPRLGEEPGIERENKGALPIGKEHILFVDDEESLVIIGKTALERLGYTVTAMTDSTEALEAFKERADSFDLVITDQTLPMMTGMEFAQKLMHIRSDIPVIITTGFSEAATKEKAKNMGIREYIMKPIRIRDLAKSIRRILDKGGA